MKAIVCEMCGSQNLVKQDGYYVCQNCGTKYDPEEAKKLMVEVSGSVKVDKSEEVEKALILARRARTENNAENALRYYSKVLEAEPNNWEAGFFQVYYRALQCNVFQIESAAQSVVNTIPTTMMLIHEISDKQERDSAKATVCAYAVSIAEIMGIAVDNAYQPFKSQGGPPFVDAKRRIGEVRKIIIAVYVGLDMFFPEKDEINTKLIVETKKKEAEFVSKYAKYIGDNAKSIVKEREKEIQKTDASYSAPQVKKDGCYIATAVYGSYDCPQVWTLRRYRDYTLAETWYGRAFIHTYYAISPTLVKWFGETDWFKNMWKPKLDKMVKELNEKGVADTPYQDRNW